jgi:geranylgeranyl pyrophosphate synthase
MMAPLDAAPLSDQRASLQRYLSGIVTSFDSVAGRIIAERLPDRHARDPVRAALVLWASAAANGAESGDALPVAAAFDLFDRFMQLHDELADESAETTARWGLGQSLNAGDALYAVAFHTLASEVRSPLRRLEAARLAGEAVLRAIEGPPPEGRASLTGAALRAGAVIGGAGDDVASRYERAGYALGMAAETADAARAEHFAREAIAALEPCTRKEDLETFAEVARYVARRAA